MRLFFSIMKRKGLIPIIQINSFIKQSQLLVNSQMQHVTIQWRLITYPVLTTGYSEGNNKRVKLGFLYRNLSFQLLHRGKIM